MSTANRTIQEILRLSPQERVNAYGAKIDYIKINGNVFENYGAYTFVWAKSYTDDESLGRSISGSMDNIANASSFITPRLIIDFSIMSIDDYRRLMQMYYSANEFVVECYDTVYDRITTNKMYFATETEPKLYTIAERIQKGTSEWEDWVSVAGVTEYQVEMIGTNNDLDNVNITYHLNPPTSGNDTTTGETVSKGDDLIIGEVVTFKNQFEENGYVFAKWNTSPDGKGVTYLDGYSYTINTDLVLYAVWQSTNDYKLFFNYGIGEKPTNADYSKEVVYGKAIGVLPQSTKPSVVYGYNNSEGTLISETYYPYEYDGWYKTATKAQNSEKLTASTLYWVTHDTTIYQLFTTAEYTVSFDLAWVAQSYGSIKAEYGTTLTIPEPKSSTYKFVKWQMYRVSDGQFIKDFDGKMPPFDIKLVAVWEV